jgi:Ecdysteroid kinase-like family
MTDRLPTTTSEITSEWLTEALRESSTIGPDVTVASVSVDPQAGGVGFMGEVGKLTLTYEGEAGSAPTSMVAKFATQSPEIKAMMHPTRVFEREHRFYANISSDSPVRTPDIYHVTCDVAAEPNDECYMLLMEDLGELTLGDQLAGVSPEQAEAALVGLAAHHARFWNGAGLENAPYIPVINGPLNKAGQSIYDASLPGFKEVFGSVLRPEMVPVADAYGRNHPKMLDRFAAMPHTLVHFDFRADNLFFETAADGSTGDVVVIDWQSISVGGGAADVGYFLGQNLSTDDRRAHEADLLHRYHETLVANGVTGYEYDQFFDDYRLAVVYGWVIPVFAVGSLDSSSERAMALWNTVIDRIQDAIFDHDAQQFIEV